MHCLHCNSLKIRKLKATTNLGYVQYYCNSCCKQFNERTGTDLNYIQYPTEVVMLVVYHYCKFKVSLDDVVELMAMRGLNICHQTVNNWVQTFGVKLGIKLRTKRKGKVCGKWHVDSTHIQVEGIWCYLYRAIDKNGNLVDVYLSDKKDQTAAEAFFTQAQKTSGIIPEQITTDKESALYPAIKKIFGKNTRHRDVKYKNNLIEQSHRGIKSRTKIMKGFKNIFCALNFCTIFEEIKQLFNLKNKTRATKRGIFASKFQEFNNLLGN